MIIIMDLDFRCPPSPEPPATLNFYSRHRNVTKQRLPDAPVSISGWGTASDL
jgi:hypothetical protein